MSDGKIVYNILKKIDSKEQISDREKEIIKECKELDWSYYNLNNIPHSISQLTQLRFLDLSGTKLSFFPDEVCELVQLIELVLRDNNLTVLPAKFVLLKQIKILDLSNNPWSEVPAQIRKLKKLEYINLSYCTFKEIPDWIMDFNLDFQFSESARGIILEKTTSITPDISLFHQKRATILKYFQRLNENGLIIRETKVIFLGDGLVGKTYTIDRINNDGKRMSLNHNTDQTKGISIIHKDFEWNQQSVTLHFWDFGGQEIMHSMHRCFLTNNLNP